MPPDDSVIAGRHCIGPTIYWKCTKVGMKQLYWKVGITYLQVNKHLMLLSNIMSISVNKFMLLQFINLKSIFKYFAVSAVDWCMYSYFTKGRTMLKWLVKCSLIVTIKQVTDTYVHIQLYMWFWFGSFDALFSSAPHPYSPLTFVCFENCHNNKTIKY